ncbi:MAG: dihydrolipoyl dehydrogenase [Candidatus Margulisbacteria bacterium]|nr:dihydrolipoyl dehydrogenase [Candidatus Margulisiibacteriota bacterium]
MSYDILIVGAGPGGYVAAIRAAQMGAKIVLIEKDKLGGTCLNYGCIPTKALIACTTLFEKIQKAGNFGITTGNVSLDLDKVIERKNKIVEKLVKGIEFLLEKNKIELIYGGARVLEAENSEIRKVEISPASNYYSNCCGIPLKREKVDNSELIVESRKLILATGSLPYSLPSTPFDGKRFLSSDDLLDNPQHFEKLNIVGGGVIGLHFAQIYSSLGTKVTIYEALPEILPGIDEEVVATIKRILKRKGVEVLTNAKFTAETNPDPTLICVGRRPNLIGIEGLNLKMEGKSVWVNEKMETSVPGIYAIGDLVSKKMFAHVASEQGIIAAENALGGNRLFTYDHVPYGIYTQPEIGSVGLTEKEARVNHPDIRIGRFPFAALGIAQAMGEIEGFIKIISDKDDKILGVHILGPEATTLIGSALIAMRNGLTGRQLADSIQAHPSYSEGIQEAALNIYKHSLHVIN